MPLSPFIAQLLLGLIFAGGLFMWLRMIGRLMRREPLIDRQWEKPVPWEGVDVLLIVGTFIITQFICGFIALRTFGVHMPFDLSHTDPQRDLAILSGNLAASIETFVIGVCILRLRCGASLTEMGFDLRYFSEDVATGLAAFLIAAPVVYGVQLILVELIGIKYEHPVIEAVKEAPSGLMLSIATMSAVVVAPVVEEFLFRIVLQGWLEKVELRLTGYPPVSSPTDEQPLQNPDTLLPTYVEIPPVPLTARGLYGLPLGLVPILVSSTLFALVHWGQGARASSVVSAGPGPWLCLSAHPSLRAVDDHSHGAQWRQHDYVLRRPGQ